MSELLWIAVPNGVIADPNGGPTTRASVRVLVVPRLTGVINISEAGLDDWPTLLAEQASFVMRTRTSVGDAPAARRPKLVPRARPEIWAGFFGGEAGNVNEFEPKTNPAPTVAPTYEHARNVAASYRTVTRVAAKPANDAVAASRAELTKWAAPEPPRLPESNEPPAYTVPDFHATVATLREHPTVLLDLGLIFELVVEISDLNRGNATAGRQLTIQCDDPPSLENMVTSPWTRYELDLSNPDPAKQIFRPAPGPDSDSGIRRGVLDLSNSVHIDSNEPTHPTSWAIATFDINGAVDNLRQTGRDITANEQAAPVMPPMRSIGLALLRPDRAADFANRVHTATRRAAASMTDEVLDADDLVLGYRVDIRRESGSWRSVCERAADYRIGGITIGRSPQADLVHEEGHIKPFAAVKDADGALHSDGMLLRWNGWNLALGLPNLRGDTLGNTIKENPNLPYAFHLEFAIRPHRLPALRFADRYRILVRVADIAGGGVELGDVDGSQQASASVTYRRHDPIQPPQLRASGPFTPGAAIDRLVVRSDGDVVDPDYPATDSRTLDPPTASLQLVEQHGKLDPPLTDAQSFAYVKLAMSADANGSGLPDPVAEGINAVVPKEAGGAPTELAADIAWSPGWPNQTSKTLELKARTSASPPVAIGWIGNTLQIILGKAKQATVNLSSTIRGNMEDHLALSDYLTNPPIPTEDTKLGRNPLVTPPRRILVVHAVKRPLAEPLWRTPVDLARANGDTAVVLKPKFDNVDSGAGLNPDSTGRLDIAAAWTEFEDVGPKAGPGKRPVSVEHLDSQSIPPVDAPSPDHPTPPGPISMAIRHEFGDTKRRRVTYTLNASSRYREYFDPTTPESEFHRQRAQPEVNVKSSARPPVPVVVGVVPAFQWQRQSPTADRIEHTRQSQRLRVELARPWFQTGEGEQLAVVLAPTDNSPAAASGLVTRIGRDPLFASPATPPRPAASWFPNGAAARQVNLPEINAQVTVIPFDVIPAEDRWYADIDIALPATAQSYNPFVQLAVARYQFDSLDGLTLSPVVVTDRVPLLPDRHVVVARSASKITVSVDGVSPNPLNRLDAILESCGAGVAPETLDLVLDDAAAEPQLVAWRPVPGGTVQRTPAGSIPPLTLTATAGRFRLRLRETEDRLGEANGASPADVRRRNVFVDTIVLPREWQPT